jgi:hypothetical protein
LNGITQIILSVKEIARIDGNSGFPILTFDQKAIFDLRLAIEKELTANS